MVIRTSQVANIPVGHIVCSWVPLLVSVSVSVYRTLLFLYDLCLVLNPGCDVTSNALQGLG